EGGSGDQITAPSVSSIQAVSIWETTPLNSYPRVTISYTTGYSPIIFICILYYSYIFNIAFEIGGL
ncbi:hypothetical protein, partial [Aeromonas sp. JL9]|uniref:hypothetical protein n=1 Tax=Aeromonas sp. JL9 TaxID=2950549 RepID=UPI00210B8CE8